MNHDALDGLWRRLVAGSGGERDGGRPYTAERRTAGPADPVLADGGQRSDDEDDAHLRDLPDGAGCTEIWEHLSERQAEGGSEEGRPSECRADD